jgi:hypothetical protein
MYALTPEVVDIIARYLIIPLLGWLWVHDRKLNNQDKEIARLIAILNERDHRRTEDREDQAQILRDLSSAIRLLNNKLENNK